MSDVAFQVWDANGQPMVNLRMNTMRLVDRVNVGRMDTDTKTIYHSACRAATTKAFVMPTTGGFNNYLVDIFSSIFHYNMRPRIRVFDGYFELYVRPGTMDWIRSNTSQNAVSENLDVLLFTSE